MLLKCRAEYISIELYLQYICKDSIYEQVKREVFVS